MQLRVVQRIQSAVESVTACTAPAVQVGGVVAAASRLNSPYISHRTVDYKQADRLPAGVLYAFSGNHAIVVGADDPEGVVPAFPLGGLVAAWEGGLVPTSLVRPVYNLAQQLGLRPEQPGGELVAVHVLTPTLAGWHFGRPVFWAAGGENDNTPFRLDGEPAYRQGNLLVGWYGGDIIVLPTWECWGEPIRYLFNHYIRECTTPVEEQVPPSGRAVITPVAVLYQGVPHAAVRLVSGGRRVYSRDHEDLVVPTGDWVAIHPFPARQEVVD